MAGCCIPLCAGRVHRRDPGHAACRKYCGSRCSLSHFAQVPQRTSVEPDTGSSSESHGLSCSSASLESHRMFRNPPCACDSTQNNLHPQQTPRNLCISIMNICCIKHQHDFSQTTTCSVRALKCVISLVRLLYLHRSGMHGAGGSNAHPRPSPKP